jgi:hypothetical protein
VGGEISDLIWGWSLVIVGGFIAAFAFVLGWPIAGSIWLANALFGLYLLISVFVEYQIPNFPEYKQYYKDKLEFERIVLSEHLKKAEK